MRNSYEYLARGTTEMSQVHGKLTLSIMAAMLLPIAGARIASAADETTSRATLVSVTVEAGSSRSAELYRVPSGMRLLVTQACQEHPAMYVELGTRGERISYNGNRCTRFEPGFAVEGGETIHCVNKSGETRNCVLLGVLERSPNKSPGVKFYDVSASAGK
jgi:hypothetical protein